MCAMASPEPCVILADHEQSSARVRASGRDGDAAGESQADLCSSETLYRMYFPRTRALFFRFGTTVDNRVEGFGTIYV